jgi:hypothetical protein
MEKIILLDLANESVRRYGDLPPDFADKMAKRIRRKFSVKVESQNIFQFALHYKEIYEFGKSILRECIRPSNGRYADSSDVYGERFLNRLREKFPEDDTDILNKISGWIVYYEYLR